MDTKVGRCASREDNTKVNLFSYGRSFKLVSARSIATNFMNSHLTCSFILVSFGLSSWSVSLVVFSTRTYICWDSKCDSRPNLYYINIHSVPLELCSLFAALLFSCSIHTRSHHRQKSWEIDSETKRVHQTSSQIVNICEYVQKRKKKSNAWGWEVERRS